MTFSQVLRALPHLSAIGLDDPQRLGFETSRKMLEADEEGFRFVCRWLETHEIRGGTTRHLPPQIENTTRRRVSHGVTVAAVKAMCIPFNSVYAGGLKF